MKICIFKVFDHFVYRVFSEEMTLYLQSYQFTKQSSCIRGARRAIDLLYEGQYQSGQNNSYKLVNANGVSLAESYMFETMDDMILNLTDLKNELLENESIPILDVNGKFEFYIPKHTIVDIEHTTDLGEAISIIDEYQDLAFRTCAELEVEKLNLSHMMLGLSSELSELFEAFEKSDVINISEEIGDIFWYIANYCTFRNYKFANLLKVSNTERFLNEEGVAEEYINLTCSISNLSDLVKRYVAYDKDIDVPLEMEYITSCIIQLYILLEGAPLTSCLQANINKLQVRYPEKFDTALALQRRLDLEFEALDVDF